MGAQNIELVIGPQEYFREKVLEAKSNLNLDVQDEVEFYLVNLLCEYINPSQLAAVDGSPLNFDTPLAVMLAKALDAPPHKRLKILKYLGDSSLYVSGFFQDYFNRKVFDIGYYIDLGSAAYNNVSSIMRELHGDEHFASMYQDMAEQFTSLVDVIAEVAQAHGADKPVDILAIYDRWTRSNSDRLARMLQRFGIVPQPTPTRERQ